MVTNEMIAEKLEAIEGRLKALEIHAWPPKKPGVLIEKDGRFWSMPKDSPDAAEMIAGGGKVISSIP